MISWLSLPESHSGAPRNLLKTEGRKSLSYFCALEGIPDRFLAMRQLGDDQGLSRASGLKRFHDQIRHRLPGVASFETIWGESRGQNGRRSAWAGGRPT